MRSLSAIITVLTSALDRNTPRTCTPEIASVAKYGDNSEAQATLVADLVIDSATQKVDFSNSVPLDSYLASPERVKEAMQQLLELILGFFEAEAQKVESGVLKEEEVLLNSYVQEDDTDTKRPTRLPPKNPYQCRAEDPSGDHQAD